MKFIDSPNSRASATSEVHGARPIVGRYSSFCGAMSVLVIFCRRRGTYRSTNIPLSCQFFFLSVSRSRSCVTDQTLAGMRSNMKCTVGQSAGQVRCNRTDQVYVVQCPLVSSSPVIDRSESTTTRVAYQHRKSQQGTHRNQQRERGRQ